MAHQGATLQNFNNELVKCLEDLREKRETLNKSIQKEEKAKQDIQKKLHSLTEQLHRANESLAQKIQARNEYDTTISETEAAYMKILESSQTLLHVLKRETVNLVRTLCLVFAFCVLFVLILVAFISFFICLLICFFVFLYIYLFIFHFIFLWLTPLSSLFDVRTKSCFRRL
jgi:Sjoegren syndrome nuclear autoantigen 1